MEDRRRIVEQNEEIARESAHSLLDRAGVQISAEFTERCPGRGCLQTPSRSPPGFVDGRACLTSQPLHPSTLSREDSLLLVAGSRARSHGAGEVSSPTGIQNRSSSPRASRLFCGYQTNTVRTVLAHDFDYLHLTDLEFTD